MMCKLVEFVEASQEVLRSKSDVEVIHDGYIVWETICHYLSTSQAEISAR